MKSKILKLMLVIALILTMSLSNFIFVGSNLISYAAEILATNNENVSYDAYFKDQNGNKITEAETLLNNEELKMYVQVTVENEGYFNGKIEIDSKNFEVVGSNSKYVNKIDGNTVTLNQISAGSTVEIEINIKPTEPVLAGDDYIYDVALLNAVNTIKLTGIYRDSTEEDIEITAEREITLKLIENYTEENISSEVTLLTNKVMKVEGIDKRVIQISYKYGVGTGEYPIKQIDSVIDIPIIDGSTPEIEINHRFENTNKIDWNYDGDSLNIQMVNNANEDGYIYWNTESKDEVIVTFIYDRGVNPNTEIFSATESLTLQNDKKINSNNSITLTSEQVDSIVNADMVNFVDGIMYKGNIYSDIDQQIVTGTELQINFPEVVNNIEVVELPTVYVTETADVNANAFYNSTVINRDNFIEIFGENGKIEFYNTEGNVIHTITSTSPTDANGNISIKYETEYNTMTIKTSKPIEKGNFAIAHVKTIRQIDEVYEESALSIKTTNEVTYNVDTSSQYTEGTTLTVNEIIELKESVTEATLEVDKSTLSTLISNDIKIEVDLLSNSSKYDLYKNPTIIVKFPSQVEELTLNNVNLLYEEELKVKSSNVVGNEIHIVLEGQQTKYKAENLEAAKIVINATVNVDKSSITSDEKITVQYINENANMYKDGNSYGIMENNIQIVAPHDVTSVLSIEGLGIETVGDKEEETYKVEKSQPAKAVEVKFEIYNNNDSDIADVMLIGNLPTNNKTNNMDISLTSLIGLTKTENVSIYYTENEEATTDVTNQANGWKTSEIDSSKVKKYLIIVENMKAKESIIGTFGINIPANLEYNKQAEMNYSLEYTSVLTGIKSESKSTNVILDTGIGPKIEKELTATVRNLPIEGTIKTGEVITYTVTAKNVGTETANNVKLIGVVPEGTTRVVPTDDYVYENGVYYKETTEKTVEKTVPQLAAGETTTISYEVRVNESLVTGTKIENESQVIYNDITTITNKIVNDIENGDLRVTIKRVTDLGISLSEKGSAEYVMMIENISSDKKENVTATLDYPEFVELQSMYVLKNALNETNSTVEDRKVEESINIGTLEPGQMDYLVFTVNIDAMPENVNEINLSGTTTVDNVKYNSNYIIDAVETFDISLSKSSTTDKYVKNSDLVNYVLTITNNKNTIIDKVEIKDYVPTDLSIEKVLLNGEEQIFVDNVVLINTSLNPNETKTINIEARVKADYVTETEKIITNTAEAFIVGSSFAKSQEVTHIIEPFEYETDNDNDSDNPGVADGNKIISGTAWFDENENGIKEENEDAIQGVNVKLISLANNSYVKTSGGATLDSKTNASGIYTLSGIPNGQYIAVFEYDKEYAPTKFEVSGVSEQENSNVMIKDVTVGTERISLASTDIITVENGNIADINIGLIELKNFDLQLDKYVSKIITQNNSGTKQVEFNNASIAKMEIDDDYLSGTTAIIEYNIVVTNVGDVEGYAKSIIDNLPTDLEFSSELNRTWYQTNEGLQNDSLENDIIKPGESKTIKLIVTKTMTQSNTGLSTNTAEILESYNELGLEDSNSTPGNRNINENDYSSADVILSVGTGGGIYIAIIGIILAATVSIATVIVIKKRKIRNI